MPVPLCLNKGDNQYVEQSQKSKELFCGAKYGYLKLSSIRFLKSRMNDLLYCEIYKICRSFA